jgi:hypothetical protein
MGMTPIGTMLVHVTTLFLPQYLGASYIRHTYIFFMNVSPWMALTVLDAQRDRRWQRDAAIGLISVY